MIPRDIRAEYAEAILHYLVQKDGTSCNHCGKKLRFIHEASPDHITPVSLGGENKLENFRLSCRKCNRFRGKRKKSV